jgi:hypothetical protein
MTFTAPVFTKLTTAEQCYVEICYTEFHTYLSRSMGNMVQIYIRPDVKYDCHWSIFIQANPRLLNKKYFYTEFHENPTDGLDTGSMSQTDGLILHLRRSH